jgi:hypothetical protein
MNQLAIEKQSVGDREKRKEASNFGKKIHPVQPSSSPLCVPAVAMC